VQSGTSEVYTRNGQLKLNANNEVVTSTGQRVLGFGVNDDFELLKNPEALVPLSIPLGKERVSQTTRNASFSGVLNPSVDLGATPSISQSIVLGDGTIPQPQAAVATQPFDINDFAEIEQPATFGIVDAPGAAGTGPNAGAPIYRLVFLDGAGNESTPSGPFGAAAAGGTAIDFSGLPTGTGAFTAGRRLYRQEDGGTSFYQVAEVNDNLAGSTLTDAVDEAALAGGQELDTELINPGGFNYYVSFYDSNSQIETRPTARIGTRSIAAPGGRVNVDLSDLGTPTHPIYNIDQNPKYLNL